MSRQEFLNILEEALTGEVPPAVIRDNLNYYGSYLSQEMEKGRTVDEIVEETGGPRIIAQTIIDASEAGGESGAYDGGSAYGGQYDAGSAYGDGESAYDDGGNGPYSGSYRNSEDRSSGPNIHYIDLNKWYWRILIPIILIVVVCVLVYAVGGVFYLLVRFAGPLLLIYLLYRLIRNNRR